MTDKPYTIIETADPLKHLPAVDLTTKPIAKAHAAMIDELSRLRCPMLPVTPSADDFGAVADYVVNVARIADRWLNIVGQEVRANSTRYVDMRDFTEAFFGAVDGFCLFEIDACGERVREEAAEIDRAPMSDFGKRLFDDMARLNRALYGSKES